MAKKSLRSARWRHRTSVVVIALAATGAGRTTAFAAQLFSWSGVEASPIKYRWSRNGNWTGGVAPPVDGGDDVTLEFDGTPPGLNAVNDLGKFALNQMHFGTTAGAYVITPADVTDSLVFAVDGAQTPSLLNNSSSTITLPSTISFVNGLQVGGSGAGVLALTGNVAGRGVLTKSGPGVATLNSPGADLVLDQLAVTGGVLNIVGGTQVLANAPLAPQPISTVTGGATINIDGAGSKLVGHFTSQIGAPTAGAINVTAGGRLESFSSLSQTWWGREGGGRAILIDGSGSTWEHLAQSRRMEVRGSATTITIANGGALTTASRLMLVGGSHVTVNGGTATIGGLESFSGPSELKLSDGAGSASALTITGANPTIYDDIIADGPGGGGSITMLGGEQTFNNVANAYSGGTRLLGGVLRVAGEGALGTGSVLFNGGSLVFTSTATLQRTPLFGLNGGGLGAASGATLTIDHALSLTMPLTITDAGTVRLTGANTYEALRLDSGTLELTNDADAIVFGTLIGNAATLAKFGDGVLTLRKPVADGANFNGAIVVVNEGALRLTHARAMNDNVLDLQKNDGLILDLGPSPAEVPLRGLRGPGNVDLGAHSLVLGKGAHGFSHHTGTIQGSGSVIIEGRTELLGVNAYAGGTILNHGSLTIVPSTTTGDIIVGVEPGDLSLRQDVDGAYAGNLVGFAQVQKLGAGMLTLTGTGFHTARVHLQEGGLAASADLAGSLTGGGSSLTFMYAGTTFRALSDGEAGITLFESATIDTNGHRVTTDFLVASNSNQAIVTKAGAGVYSVPGGGSVYGFHALGGALELGADFFVGAGGVTIADSASLTGNATLSGNAGVLLQSGGAIAPGLDSQAIGTLGTNSLIWDDGGVLKFDLAGASSADRIGASVLFGKGASGAEGFTFDFTGATPTDGGLYLLVAFGSTDFVAGDFDYVGLPPGASGAFEMQAGALYFHATVVPEPAGIALIVMGLGVLRLRRRGLR